MFDGTKDGKRAMPSTRTCYGLVTACAPTPVNHWIFVHLDGHTRRRSPSTPAHLRRTDQGVRPVAASRRTARTGRWRATGSSKRPLARPITTPHLCAPGTSFTKLSYDLDLELGELRRRAASLAPIVTPSVGARH